MTDRLAIDEKNQLKEIAVSDAPVQPVFIKGLANIFSYIFHPLFIPVYIILFLLKLQPQVFAGLDDWGKLGNLLQVFVNCTFLPLVTVLLLKGLKFIDSVFLRTQKDRIIPYIICMIYFFNCWYAFRNNHGARELESMSMAVFNACVFGFLANIFLKVSMHAIGVGVMGTFMTLLAFNESTNQTLYLSIAILITGIVCTSRLIVSDHSTKEIYTGLVIGIFSQLAADYFVN